MKTVTMIRHTMVEDDTFMVVNNHRGEWMVQHYAPSCRAPGAVVLERSEVWTDESTAIRLFDGWVKAATPLPFSVFQATKAFTADTMSDPGGIYDQYITYFDESLYIGIDGDQFYLILGNEEHYGYDLTRLERILWEYGASEGYYTAAQ